MAIKRDYWKLYYAAIKRFEAGKGRKYGILAQKYYKLAQNQSELRRQSSDMMGRRLGVIKDGENPPKKKKWWLGVRENGNLEVKYLVSALSQPWIYTKGANSINILLDYVEDKGIDPRSIKGLPPFVFGKRFGKRR